MLVDELHMCFRKLLKKLLQLILVTCAHDSRGQVTNRHLLEMSNAGHLQTIQAYSAHSLPDYIKLS